MVNMGNDELDEYLDALKREDCYRVDAVLKASPYEVTQKVSFVCENGAVRGPFIRKYIKREAGLGSVYERLFSAQQNGQRFKHLPDVLECYARDDDLVVVMEYAHGETLQDLVYREDASLRLAREVFPQLCDAVSELHEDFAPPIIHRDLKPSNVIVSQGGCTIIDFGIAREYKDGVNSDTKHFGTRAFAPPEQFGFGQTTVRSDVYALGMLLYFCLTEKIPDGGVQPDWLDESRIPPAVRDVIARATAFDPQQRYASARDLKDAFLKAVDGAAPGEGRAVGPNDRSDGAYGEPIPYEPQVAQLQSAAMPFAQAVDSGPEGAPHVVGRVWNAVVTAAFIVLSAAFAYWTVRAVFFEPGLLDVAPWAAVVRMVIGIAFLALFAFACLDKRRIRGRFPAFANVRAWQVWVIVLIVYALVALFNRIV